MTTTVLGSGSGNSGNQGTGQGNTGNSGDQGGNSGGQGTGGSGSGSSGGTGGGQASWRDSLPEDIRGNPALQSFSDVGNLAKSYIHAQSQIGKKGVFVPGEKATDEDWKVFYKAIGQPEADKFEVKLPDGVEVNANLMGKFKEAAHSAGLLPKQAQGILDWYTKQNSETIKSQMGEVEKIQKEQIAGLRKEWGEGYDKQVALANLAVNEVGGQEFAEYLKSTGLGNDVKLIRTFAKVGKLLGEDRVLGEASGKFGKTPAEIQDSIDRVMGDPKSPYFDKAHPGHQKAVKDMEDHYRMLAQSNKAG